MVRLVRRRLLRGPPPSSLNMSSTADALTVTNFGTFPLDVVITIVLVGCPDMMSVFVTICKESWSVYSRCRHEIIISRSSHTCFLSWCIVLCWCVRFLLATFILTYINIEFLIGLNTSSISKNKIWHGKSPFSTVTWLICQSNQIWCNLGVH